MGAGSNGSSSCKKQAPRRIYKIQPGMQKRRDAMNKILIYAGIIVLVLGILAGVYSVDQTALFGLISFTTAPYQAYMLPLIVVGVVLVIAGYFTGGKK